MDDRCATELELRQREIELSKTIHDPLTGDLVPAHAGHFKPWHDGFDAGYRRARRPGVSDHDRRLAATSAGLTAMDRAGCPECAEWMRVKTAQHALG